MRRTKRLVLVGVALTILVFCAGALRERPLAPAWLRYESFVMQGRARAVVHLAKVDLRTPGLRLLTTPTTSCATCFNARTTSVFLTESRADVAINASFFYPFLDQGPLNYYPHQGQPVRLAVFGERSLVPPNLVLREGADCQLFKDPGPGERVIHGRVVLVRDGKVQLRPGPIPLSSDADRPYPRTALGLDKQRTTMWLAVVEGKLGLYSAGLTLFELAQLLAARGVHDALELDGGGSSTLVTRGEGNGPVALNVPVHTRIPWRERPVANHLGFVVPR